ncbi:MAG: FKBP-type peptidyl-prolyl cis-trans isomerase [Chitinophagaceae bacterium]|nr:FKBP-type peptidyl-prolyl cis-trans isomerase [Chitinophagaceae bacterium]
MNKRFLSLAFMALVVGFSACKPKFQKLPSGILYMPVKKGNGKRVAKEGDIISMNLLVKIRDSVVLDNFKMNDGQPIETMCNKVGFHGDPMEAFMMMREGDSAVIKTPADSLYRGGMPPFAKKGDTVTFCVRMLKVQTQADYQANLQKAAKEQESKDDKTIKDYLSKNNLQAQKTQGGLYYVITQPGTGESAKAGKEVTMKYTGRLLDGTTFDSNVDPKFDHVQPFSFVLGRGRVIKGWDEGIALLNKGAKAIFVVPSGLAYGQQSLPGNEKNPKGIPANSTLVFDVELVDIKDAKEEPEAQMPQMESVPH